jgi:hypothetical protein
MVCLFKIIFLVLFVDQVTGNREEWLLLLQQFLTNKVTMRCSIRFELQH